MASVVNPTRVAAAKVLAKFKPEKQNLAELIEKYFRNTPRRPQGVDMVYGTVRNRITIDCIITAVSGRQIKKITPKLLDVLRIMIYELVYSSQSADYAILNEAVELANKFTGKKGGGFINAIGRKTLAHITNKRIELTDFSDPKILPISQGYGCRFDNNILGSIDSPAQYLAMAFSLPLWLVESWIQAFDFETALSICFGSNRRPSIYLRPNTLKIDAQKLYSLMVESDIECQLLEDVGMLKLIACGNIIKLPGFNEGLFSVQDITASKAVKLLNPEQGQKILDLCAAPGTKTMQIAELSCDKATIIATDIDSSRALNIIAACDRLDVTSVKIVDYDKVISQAPFDCILIDAPCSNSGVMAKRAEVRYRINKKIVTTLSQIQSQLLADAVKMLSRSGKICYSTCSICQDENQNSIHHFLDNNSDFELLVEEFSLPSANAIDCDGGYAAVISRK